MSRAAQRVRASLRVTARFEGEDRAINCRTRDVSHTGCFLETEHVPSPFSRVELSLLDQERGDVIQLDGAVMRVVKGEGGGVGVHADYPPLEWIALVDRLVNDRAGGDAPTIRMPRRMRILVVADNRSQRGALALYVKSGWDVRFATDLAGAEEAMREGQLDAVIAEHGPGMVSWSAVLEAARREQPDARRIVRTTEAIDEPPADLVHRVVDASAEIDALLDALTA